MKNRFKVYSVLFVVIGLFITFYAVWSPGDNALRDSNNLQSNGMWIAHGWFGDQLWFKKYKKEPSEYDESKEYLLIHKIKILKIKYLYPHLCPANSRGQIPEIDLEKIKKFRIKCPSVKIIPWIGGSTDSTVDLGDKIWKAAFISSVKDLLSHEEIDGIHVNIEPLASGDKDFLGLLSEIKKIKGDKILSVAAYPPPTFFHPHASVHWDLGYYQDICSLADQVVPMMYDTALNYRKIYTNLVRQWTKEVIIASGDKEVLFGIPAYEDANVGYHNPLVENVFMAMPGIISGINSTPDDRSFSISIYADWTLDKDEEKYISSFIK